MRRSLALAVGLSALELFLGAFRLFDWGYGWVRALLVLSLGLALLGLPSVWRGLSNWVSRHDQPAPILLGLVPLLLVISWDAAVAYRAIRYSVQTGEIRMDQGQNTYRAALEILSGRNPYGQGAMLDPVAFESRLERRAELGVGPTVPSNQVSELLSNYWRSLDPKLRLQLLPIAAPGNPEGETETRLLGYKYGPVPIALTAVLAPFAGPVAIPILNVLAVAALLVTIGFIVQRTGVGAVAVMLTVAAVAADINLQRNFLAETASDIWPLLFGSIGILAWLDGAAILLGLSVSLSVSSKLFPGLLFMPLLLCLPRRGTFIGFMVGVCFAVLPFAVWDVHGLYLNVVAWPTFMEPDSTSWVSAAAPGAVKVARLALAVFVVVLGVSLPLMGTKGRYSLTFTLICACTVLAGSAFHNNYVPWFSIFAALSVTEAWGAWQRPVTYEGA